MWEKYICCLKKYLFKKMSGEVSSPSEVNHTSSLFYSVADAFQTKIPAPPSFSKCFLWHVQTNGIRSLHHRNRWRRRFASATDSGQWNCGRQHQQLLLLLPSPDFQTSAICGSFSPPSHRLGFLTFAFFTFLNSLIWNFWLLFLFFWMIQFVFADCVLINLFFQGLFFSIWMMQLVLCSSISSWIYCTF